MNRLLPVALCLATLGLGACATNRKPPGQIVTTAEANQAGLGGAVTAPLRDLSLLRTKIPPVLLDALQNPYQPPSPYTCQEIHALIIPLDDALGADFDQPASTDDKDLITRSNETALGAVAGLAQDIIPLRGWVRRLSGAEKHDRLVSAAITGGSVRRGYLKGLGEAKSCLSPSKPRSNRFWPF